MKPRILWVVLALAALFSFLPNARDFFVGDDFCLLAQSRQLSWPALFAPGFASFFRPLPLVLYHFFGKLFGLEPLGFHLVNLLLHLLNVLLLYGVILCFTERKTVAFLAALGFAWHFAHVEAVVWISSLNELLVAAFGFLFLWGYWLSLERKAGWGWVYVASLLVLAIALASKESAVALPWMVAGLVLFYRRKNKGQALVYLGPHLLLVVGYILLRGFLGTAMPTFAPGRQGAVSLSPLDVLSNYGHFLAGLFFPLRFIFDFAGYEAYDRLTLWGPGLNPLNLVLLLSLVFFVVLLILVVRFFRPGREVWAGGIWVVAALLPYVFFTGKGERFLYLASGGAALMLAALLAALIERRRKLGVTISVLLFCLSLGICYERGRWWTRAAEVAESTLGELRRIPPSGQEVFLVNVPHRVHGAYVFTTCVGSAAHLFVPDLCREIHFVELDEVREVQRMHPQAEFFCWQAGRLVPNGWKEIISP